MGAKPAPPLANIWLSKYEVTIKGLAKIFDRYMDDIIREIKRHEIQDKLREINNLHPQLKFTMELEENGRIPFLDMEIVHTENCLSSTWVYTTLYQKNRKIEKSKNQKNRKNRKNIKNLVLYFLITNWV